MRVTCLKCGSQYDVQYDTSSTAVNCECGPAISYPEVHDAGVQPSERAAERLRYRAFQSAGLVKNVGIVALTVSAISIFFFPLATVGVGIGLYTLVSTRGPLGKYVGRPQAVGAILLGVFVFLLEGALALHWMEQRRIEHINAVQASVRDDLRGLLRTQRLYRAAQDRYGRFDDFPGRGFRPVSGQYTIYLAPDDFVAAEREGREIKDEWQGDYSPSVSADAFTAIAVANLDDDPDLDVWMLTDTGDQTHLVNDNDYLETTTRLPPKKPAAVAKKGATELHPPEHDNSTLPTPGDDDDPPKPEAELPDAELETQLPDGNLRPLSPESSSPEDRDSASGGKPASELLPVKSAVATDG